MARTITPDKHHKVVSTHVKHQNKKVKVVKKEKVIKKVIKTKKKQLVQAKKNVIISVLIVSNNLIKKAKQDYKNNPTPENKKKLDKAKNDKKKIC